MPVRRTMDTGDPAIAFERVCKRYRVRHSSAATRWGIRRWLRTPESEAVDDLDEDNGAEEDEIPEAPSPAAPAEVWALRDISFEVPRSGSLAIVGPAGAGKTTLLKILARVTIPTEGRVVLRGRVAPLIGSLQSFLQQDVDAKMNVRLLASLFGFAHKVSDRDFKAILDFAEVANLGNTRLGGYSSRQQVRLAYSAFLHLPADILAVDGSILPGDAEFSERCLERVADRVQRGAALVIAPQDVELANRLCNEAIWLDGGRLRQRGPTPEVVAGMRRELAEAKRARAARRAASMEHGAETELVVLSLTLCDESGFPTDTIETGRSGSLRIRFRTARTGLAVTCGVSLTRADGVSVRVAQEEAVKLTCAGGFLGDASLPADSLAPGTYLGRAKVVARLAGNRVAQVSDSVEFAITGSNNGGSDSPSSSAPAETGSVIHASWTFRAQEASGSERA